MATAKAATKVLADRLIVGESFLHDMARVAAANLLLVLCAWIALPLPWTPVPVTGQTFGVLLVAVLLGARRGVIVMGLYLLEGLAGLPVFQPFGLPGAARLAGPTAGYLLAYPAAAFATGWIAERPAARRAALQLFSALLAGEGIIFLGGCAWLAAGMGLGWFRALAAGVVPFLPVELIKMALVVLAVGGVERGVRLPRDARGRR